MNVFQSVTTTTTNPAGVTLLTLPSDTVEPPSHASTTTTTTTNTTTTDNVSSSSSSFVLLQLPLNCSVEDFIQNNSNSSIQNDSPNTYFVASTTKSTNNNNNNNIAAQPQSTQSMQQQDNGDTVCCIVESKHCSYTVHRIETSNTLLVVPPPLSGINNNDTPQSGDRNAESLSNNLTQVLPTHWIRKPNTTTSSSSSGSSYFLELRMKYLRLSDLRRSLFIFDPYNINNNLDDYDPLANIIGKNVSDLALALQVSQWEVQQGLHFIGAYAIQPFSGCNQQQQYYCLLVDHIRNDCYDAIVTGLYIMSDDGTEDYGGPNGIINIDPYTFVKNIVHYVQITMDDTTTTTTTTTMIHIESILLHCLQLLYKDPLSLNGTFRLDVSKVAVCIVRRLFLKRTSPYPEKELFNIWQSELPGVGPIYQISSTMLQGVAICTGDYYEEDTSTIEAISDREWHYLPVESIIISSSSSSSMDVSQHKLCFDTLFHIKDRYTMYELEPYLQHLLDTLPTSSVSSSSSMTELLLRYAKLRTVVGQDGISRTFYEKK